MSHPHPELSAPAALPKGGLRIIPLGGLGEVGRNMTVFEYDERLLIVDCGVLFPEENHPGVDLILPDFDAIRDRLDQVEALVLTHGHEDHIGATPYLLRERGDIPLVGSELTLAFLDSKLREHRLKETIHHKVKAGDRLTLGTATNDTGPASAVNVSVPPNANGTVQIVAQCGSGQGNPPLVAITVRDCGAEVGLFVVDGDRSSFFKRAPYSETIDISQEPLLGALSSQLSAINVLPGATVTIEKRLAWNGYSFYSTGAKRVDTAPASVDLPPLTGVDQLTVTAITNNNHTQVISKHEPFTQGTTSVDASAGLLAEVSSATFTPSSITWTEEVPAGAPDLVIASLDVTRDGDTNPNTNSYVRRIVAPYTGATLRMPILSGAAAIYNPAEKDQVGTSIGVAQLTGGYDAARPHAFSGSSLLDAAPMNGSLTLSYTGGGLPGI